MNKFRGDKVPEIKNMKKLGQRTIDVMEYGSGGNKIKKIKRVVYSEKTLTPRIRIYWFQLYKGEWRNTTLKGIKHGITVPKGEFKHIK